MAPPDADPPPEPVLVREAPPPERKPIDESSVEIRLEEVRHRIEKGPLPLAAVKLVFPLAVAALHLATLPLIFPGRWLPMFGFIWAYFLPPAGKESIIPAAIAAGYNPWLVALYIAAVDAIVGLFLVWNWDLTTRIPLAGGAIRKGIRAGERVLHERPWIHRLSFAGVVMFVMVPFQGSGALGGSIVGRMIGLPPYRAWLAIIVGSVLGTTAIAGLVGSIQYAFEQAAGTGVAVLVAMLLVLVATGYLWIGNRANGARDGDGAEAVGSASEE